MAGGNASMADWDPNEAPRTRLILADSHVLPEPRCTHAGSSQIVILSTSPARPPPPPRPAYREPCAPSMTADVSQPVHGIRARARYLSQSPRVPLQATAFLEMRSCARLPR